MDGAQLLGRQPEQFAQLGGAVHDPLLPGIDPGVIGGEHHHLVEDGRPHRDHEARPGELGERHRDHVGGQKRALGLGDAAGERRGEIRPAASLQQLDHLGLVKPQLLAELGRQGLHRAEADAVTVDNQLDPATGTIRGRATFRNPEGLFTPGLFARIKLLGSGQYQAVLISDRAVGTDQSQKFVLVVGADKTLSYRPVKLGRIVQGLRVVLDGLQPGETIVVNGIQRVRPGMPVSPQIVPMDKDVPASARLPEVGGGATQVSQTIEARKPL